MTSTQKPILLDASQKHMGRLAGQIARLLMGKHRATYRPHHVPVHQVLVRNCSKIHVEKKKHEQKIYYRTSGHPGRVHSERLGDVFAKDPREALRRSVWGMLPKNTLRRTMMKNLDLQN